MPRRSKIEIYGEILIAIGNGISKPTTVMYSTNLSWKPLKAALSELEGRKFIKRSDPVDGRSVNSFVLTDEGEVVMRGYVTLRSSFIGKVSS
jgi:predicted transcriptional regulator